MLPTTAMDARGNTKRSRTATDATAEPLTAWQRIVMKLLFVVARLTEMMVRIAGLARPKMMQPFSAFPGTPGVYHTETLSEIAEEEEDLQSWEGIYTTEPGNEHRMPKQHYTINFRAPVSPGSSMNGSQISEVTHGNYVTEDDLVILGPPPLCQHGHPSKIFISRKEGPNHSRLFWRCSQPRHQQCPFFAWTLYQPYWSEEETQPVSQKGKGSKGSSLRSTRPGTPTMTIPSSPTTPTGSEVTSRCLHRRITKQGTNGSIYQEKCADCGKLLKREARGSDNESNKSTKGAASSSSRPRMTKETLEEFQEYQEFRKWKQSRNPKKENQDSD